jgi:hypothetical protein
METYKYPVRETINGITLIFNGPEMDPAPDGPKHEKDKDGFIEEYFLWKDSEDTPATHNVWRIPDQPSGHKILVETRRIADGDTWEYEIWANKQKFRRRHGGGAWSGEDAVSTLRIRVGSETDSPAIDQIKTQGSSIRIEHKGSDCSLTWNPSTRKYTRRC